MAIVHLFYCLRHFAWLSNFIVIFKQVLISIKILNFKSFFKNHNRIILLHRHKSHPSTSFWRPLGQRREQGGLAAGQLCSAQRQSRSLSGIKARDASSHLNEHVSMGRSGEAHRHVGHRLPSSSTIPEPCLQLSMVDAEHLRFSIFDLQWGGYWDALMICGQFGITGTLNQSQLIGYIKILFIFKIEQ